MFCEMTKLPPYINTANFHCAIQRKFEFLTHPTANVIFADFLAFRQPKMENNVITSPVILFGSSYCSYYWDLIEIFRFEILGFTVWIMLKMFWFLVDFVELVEGFCIIAYVDLICVEIGGWNDRFLVEKCVRRTRQSDSGNNDEHPTVTVG